MFERDELKKFTTAGRAIAEATRVTFEAWAEREAATILKLWAANVPQANAEKAEIRGRSRAAGEADVQRGEVTVNTGRRGGVPGKLWLRSGRKKNGGRGYTLAGTMGSGGTPDWMHRHYPDEVWQRLSAKVSAYGSLMPAAVRAGLGAIALARQSVVQIADALGYALESVPGGNLSAADLAKARGAVASDGKRYVNGTGSRERTADNFSITMIDRYPRISVSRIDTALESVLRNRLSLHTTTLQGPMKTALERVARANPAIEIV